MDTVPSVTVRSRLDAHDVLCWKVTLRRLDDLTFELTMDGLTYRYPVEFALEILNVLCDEQIHGARQHEFLIVQNNLGIAPRECKGKMLYKTLFPVLRLFRLVERVSGPPVVVEDYQTC
jgi:hypothetical protein